MFSNGSRFSMLSIRKSILSINGIVSLFFMGYSGYIKWIPAIPFDPFVFFVGLLCINIFLDGFKNILGQETLKISIILTLFFFWAFLTTAWGDSQVYYAEKMRKSIVIVICFLSPFFVLRTEKRIMRFIELFHWLTFLTASTIFILFIVYGDFFVVFYTDSTEEMPKIPDYLALGVLLSSGFILSFYKRSTFWLIYKTIIIIAILLLAPRGPLLLLCLFTIIYYFINGKLRFKWHLGLYAVVTLIFVIYYGEELTGRLFERFSGIFDSNSSAFSSVGSRIELLNAAVDYFKESPIVGIGYGSFGFEFTGQEDRIAPHNILLEIAAETGVIGVVLFFIFLFGVYFYTIGKKIKNDPVAIALIMLTLYLISQSLSTTYLTDSKALFLWLGILSCYYSKRKTIALIEEENIQ